MPSLNTRRYLTEEKPVQLGQVSKKAALRQAFKALEQWGNLPDEEKNTSAERQIAEKLPPLQRLLGKAIAEG